MANKIFSTLALSMALSSAGAVTSSLPAAEAAAAQELAKNSGCLSCHALDEKIVGPAYVKVAAKYAANSDAVESIADSVRNGSQGKWGRTAMPAHPDLPKGDLDKLTRWVMSLKP